MNLLAQTCRNFCYKPSFKGYSGDYDNYETAKFHKNNKTIDYDTYQNDIRKSTGKGVGAGLIAGALGMSILATFAMHADDKDNNKKLDKFINTTDSIINSDNIKKDTFMVKDMNGDEKPDFVLFKKDGSKIILDMANKEILEEKTTFNPIK